MSPTRVTADLSDWADVRDERQWSALLLGNGASQAVWRDFGYRSLYQQARLSTGARAVFTAADTENFEIVLDSLKTSRAVCHAVGHRETDVMSMYADVQSALLAAVREVHVPWVLLPDATLLKIERHLYRYQTVYTTNYDLLAYWAIMTPDQPRIRDYFWNSSSTFDATDTDIWGTTPVILYLHGGLHLRMNTVTGVTSKRTAAGKGLLNFGTTSTSRNVPLFVSEGRSADKMRSIRRSDYLSFAYQTLVSDGSPLVVFGSSLADNDAHIVAAVRANPRRHVAFGLRRAQDLAVIREKTRILELLEDQRVSFFNSSTHPLGRPGLMVTP